MTWEGLTTFCSKCRAPVRSAFGMHVQPCGCGTLEDLDARKEKRDLEDQFAYKEYKDKRENQEYLDFVRNRRSDKEDSGEGKE